MFPTNSQTPINLVPLAVHDPTPQSPAVSNNSIVNSGNGVSSGGAHYADPIMHTSKKMQDEVEKSGTKLKQHEENMKSLRAQKNKLDDAILDLQVCLGKCISASAPMSEDGDSSHDRSEEDVVNKISKIETSAAGIFCLLKSRHGLQLSNSALSQEVLGVVATLGKVQDENLSRVFSEYLGLQTMLALVCKTFEGIKYLETRGEEGINKLSGIHAIGASIGQTLEGPFEVICLESLRPYPGECVADDPQRKLDIPKPRLPTGDIPAGFLGYAVNMVIIDKSHLFWLTSNGSGLRETLFYNLFSRLQVYRTRAEMLLALPLISNGAVSLDGGIIKAPGVFFLGYRGNVSVMFPRCSAEARLPASYYEFDKQLMKKKWEKERIEDEIRREQSLLEQEKYNYRLRKEAFIKFLADSSTVIKQHQWQTTGRDRQAPR